MATPGVFKELGLMTTSEAAVVVGVHRATIWNAIQQGHIPTKLIGNSNALRLEDVATFRDNYLRFKVTSTSAGAPAKKGRPLGAKNLHRVVVETAPVGEFIPLICVSCQQPAVPGEVSCLACAQYAVDRVVGPVPVPIDFVEEIVAERTLEKPQFPDLVAAAEASAITNCSACSGEIPDTEVQKCEHCGEDGLGNCCIDDHDCVRPSDCD